MDLQELCYFTHVKYHFEKKEAAQITIRRWYHFLKLKPNIRLYVYSGLNKLRLEHRYTSHFVYKEEGTFILFRNCDESCEIVFNNKHEMREYFLRRILRARTCFYIENDFCDNILLVLSKSNKSLE